MASPGISSPPWIWTTSPTTREEGWISLSFPFLLTVACLLASAILFRSANCFSFWASYIAWTPADMTTAQRIANPSIQANSLCSSAIMFTIIETIAAKIRIIIVRSLRASKNSLKKPFVTIGGGLLVP